MHYYSFRCGEEGHALKECTKLRHNTTVGSRASRREAVPRAAFGLKSSPPLSPPTQDTMSALRSRLYNDKTLKQSSQPIQDPPTQDKVSALRSLLYRSPNSKTLKRGGSE
ncbi:hypothetical protein C8R44DRAFT_419220 [Mycena epipterygia]|nr:hypothetical protein C8R44DRAFT_419220 [Mycena epipterygia]